jgi:hypothetical protein
LALAVTIISAASDVSDLRKTFLTSLFAVLPLSLACGAISAGHDSIGYNSVDDVFSGRGSEALPHCPQRDLMRHRGMEFLDLLQRSRQLLDLAARLDLAEISRLRDHVDRR